jgi:hypothetical protein
MKLIREANSRKAVAGFANDVNVRFVFQNSPEASPDQGMVIN